MTKAQSDADDTAKLWDEFVRDRSNQTLRNILIERYLPLVRYHGERVSARLPDEVELDDLISAGTFGLMDAIDAFDPYREVREAKVKFETYSGPRIRGAMLDELRNMDWVPRLVRSRSKKLTDANKDFSDKYGRQATHEELAAFMQLSMSELEKMMSDANAVPTVSLNKKWFETDGSKDISELDLVEDQRGEDPTIRMQKSDLLRLVTRGLTRNERLIILLYYYEDITMKEVGMALDLSESRVSQMHSDILKRLEAQLDKRRPEFAVE
ncbi:MAG: FliA/WhiG family RNA polymerase sigma factor [Planctomycetaceae bacterium]|jgi:RNA polymerase sigma factor for flagellar operon FliA|nr:FliA/WhiG family RNA polymerase sigma factor [Planctomycetaceae bacterium]